MKTLPIILIFLSSVMSLNSQDKPEALRIDYTHSGNAHTESFDVYRLVTEPYFSGSQNHMKFPFDYGNYKIEIRDLTTEKLIYSYHYNTLFNEWQATQMAQKNSRSFQESVKIPYPEQEVTAAFYSRDSMMNWHRKYQFKIDPASDFITRESPEKHKHKKIHDSGNYKQKMDLVILPDGYTKEEMEKFHKDARRFKDYLLNCQPFDKHQNKINIWTIDLISSASGTDKPTKDKWKTTILGTSFNTLGSQRYLFTYEHYKLREKAACTPYDLMFILVNEERYGGGGIFNYLSVASSDHEKADFLMVHEFGHHFACLGDEYYTSEVAMENYHNLNVEPFEPNLTTLADFDSKWKDMVSSETPVPTPVTKEYKDVVGVYEGGGYVAEGVYRPYINCTMRSAKYDNFCPVCRRAISEMLKYYTGENIK